MLVYAGSASKYFGLKLARQLGAEYVCVETRKFPDGEIYVRVEKEPRGEAAVLVQSMYRAPNDYLVEYLFLSKTLKELGAREVVGVIPYFPYARQDARFKPGEAVSLTIVLELLEKMGTDRVVTVDMHLHRVQDVQVLTRVPFVNLSVMEEIGKYFKGKVGGNVVVVGPDEEAEQWAKTVAKILGAPYTVLEKTRLGDTQVEVRAEGEVSLEERDVLIVDDIISTGGTIEAAVRRVKERGARKVYVACAHAILAQNAEYRVFHEGVEELVASDTVPSPYSVISAVPVVASYLRSQL